MPMTLQAVRTAMAADLHPEDRQYEAGFAIARAWLREMLMPPPLPRVVDASTGDPLLLVTDQFQVVDKARLAAALDASGEPHAGTDGSWVKDAQGADGVTRASATIRFGDRPDRLELFCRAQRIADEERGWFERLAGDSVRHLTREVADPVGTLGSDMRRGATSPPPANPPGVPPEALSQPIEQTLRRTYANWADEPIPALGGKTPREAIRTPAGLGRAARATIDRLWKVGKVAVPAIAFWEAGVLAGRGRLRLPGSAREWRDAVLAAGAVELPLDGAIAVRALDLSDLNDDPADRFIVATALIHGATLVTADERLLYWRHAMERHDARM